MAACEINAAVGIEQWSDLVTDLYERIARRVARIEVRERLQRYALGLLDRVERKNGWQLAEAIGDADPQGLQRLLRTTRQGASDWGAAMADLPTTSAEVISVLPHRDAVNRPPYHLPQ